MQKFQQHYQTRKTSQSQPIPGREPEMVENSAGGYVFPVDDWVRLDRFLILGTEGGSYYITEQKLTVENAQAVARCIQEDGLRTVNRIVEISESGRAPKNDPALFALAMCAGMGDYSTRKAALESLSRVARIGTHLFHFLEYVQAFRGWGRGLRNAVGNWYNDKSPDDLAYQVVKYRQRDGWTHRDALRLSHPMPMSGEHSNIFKWVAGKWEDIPVEVLSPVIQGFLKIQDMGEKASASALTPTGRAHAAQIIKDYNLPREAIPTEFLNEPEVWEALLEKMPMTAMIRNLATMTRVGLIVSLSDATRKVCEELRNEERIRKARVHPIAVLSALMTYQSGHGARGRHTWQPVSQIVDALDEAFYISFGNVEPTNKRIILALDVSGSMNSGEIAGVPGLTPRVGSCAMAMVTARTEPNHVIVAFSDQMVPFEVSPKERLDDVVRRSDALPFGGTDCSLPMLWALGYNSKSSGWYHRGGGYNKVSDHITQADAFVVYTDNETWAGAIHPSQALQQYRRETGISAKLAVVGMVSNGFSIADPLDAGMMDVIGFDTAAPNLISDFIKGGV